MSLRIRARALQHSSKNSSRSNRNSCSSPSMPSSSSSSSSSISLHMPEMSKSSAQTSIAAFAGDIYPFVMSFYFLTLAFSRGANCRFLHAGSTTSVPGAFVVELCQVISPCALFQSFLQLIFCHQDFARGRCTRGTSCRFRCVHHFFLSCVLASPLIYAFLTVSFFQSRHQECWQCHYRCL
jgi:hypothetical protein